MPIILPSGATVIESVALDGIELEDDVSGRQILTQDYPAPDRKRYFAGSADTFGNPLADSGYENRVITIRVKCSGTHVQMRARVRELTKAVGRIAQAHDGLLVRTLADDTVITFDVMDADIDVSSEWHWQHNNYAEVTLSLLCAPAGYGATLYWTGTAWSTVAGSVVAQAETSLPELQFNVNSIPGDLPARAQLVITDAQGQDQAFVQYAAQVATFPGTATSTTTAALAYEAETRLMLGGATALAVSGASGGTVVNQGTLTTTLAAMLSLASSGTAYCTHVGDYSVWARVYPGASNAGTVTLGLEWGAADFRRWTRNATVELPTTAEGTFRHVNLGHIHLPEAVRGTARWDGRIVAKSTTAGDDLAVDRIYLFPTGESYGEVRAISALASPTSLSGFDAFDQSAGNLHGKTLPIGGTWATSGGGTDLAVDDTNHWIERTAADAATRYAIAGSTTLTNTAATLDVRTAGASLPSLPSIGLILRWTDANNFLTLLVSQSELGLGYLNLVKKVASVETTLAQRRLDLHLTDWATIACVVTATGRVNVWYGPQGTTPLSAFDVQDADLATGGTLASGKVGVIDVAVAEACVREADNLAFWVAINDAAVFASQSLDVRHDSAVREDSAGTDWHEARVRGDYVTIPAANTAGTARMIIKACRNDPDTMADTGIDDINATLAVTPLYLNVP